MPAGNNINQQKQLNSEYASTRDILVEIQKGLGKQRDTTKEAAAEYRKLEGISQKLLLSEEEIVRLTDKQIQQNRDKAVAAKEGIKAQAERLMAEKGIVDINHTQISMIQNLTNAEKELLSAAKDGYQIEQDLLDAIDDELDVREDANKLLGTSGALLQGINEAAGKFGKAFGLDKVQKKMEETADETARLRKGLGQSVTVADKLKVAAAGIKEGFSQLGSNLLSPTVLLTNMLIGFNKVDKAATDFQQQTGQDMNTMSTSLTQFNGGLVTSAELIGAASDVTKEFGINANAAFSMENISEVASLKKEMGLAGKEAANLARLSKVNGGNIEAQNDSIIEGINSSNRQNKTAVAHGAALRDVANTSDGIAISYAGFPEKLGEAAAAAASMGMNLAGVDKIAGSLLDFESSITAEMEAELLTGQQLNLEKARQLALNNDLAGVAEELKNQGITSTKFSNLNRKAQEAQAKALGMSRDEMARMLLQQEMKNGLSEDALTDAQKVTAEDLKRVDAQEKFATAIAKLQQALAPIVGFFADILSNSIVIYSVMGVALLAKMPMLVKSVKGLASGFGDAFKNAKGLAKGIGGLFKKGGIKKAASSIKSSFMPGGKDTDKVNDLNKEAKPGGGKNIKKNLQGLAAGLRSMGTGPVAAGALNLGLFGVMAIPAIASLPFLLFMGKIKLNQLRSNFSALGTGLNKMAPTFVGSLALGAFAVVAGIAIASIPFLIAISLLGVPASTGLTALAGGLTALGTAAATGLPFLGIALIAALGLSLIPFGYALNLTTPAIEAFGGIIVGVFQALPPIIGAVADGFVSMMGALSIENIGALVLLGPALLLAGAGMVAFGVSMAVASVSAFLGGGIIDDITQLAMIGPQLAVASDGLASITTNLSKVGGVIENLSESLSLMGSVTTPLYGVAGGLMSIAVGLISMAGAGLLALPIFAALGGLAAIAPVLEGLGSFFGGGDETETTSDSNGMSGVEAKLDKLISLVEAGGDVYIDGASVGKTMQLSTSRMG